MRSKYSPRSSSNVTTSRSSCCAVSVTGQCATPLPCHWQRGFRRTAETQQLASKTSSGQYCQTMVPVTTSAGQHGWLRQPQRRYLRQRHHAACQSLMMRLADASTLLGLMYNCQMCHRARSEAYTQAEMWTSRRSGEPLHLIVTPSRGHDVIIVVDGALYGRCCLFCRNHCRLPLLCSLGMSAVPRGPSAAVCRHLC